jgi:hypothetical protein
MINRAAKCRLGQHSVIKLKKEYELKTAKEAAKRATAE